MLNNYNNRMIDSNAGGNCGDGKAINIIRKLNDAEPSLRRQSILKEMSPAENPVNTRGRGSNS